MKEVVVVLKLYNELNVNQEFTLHKTLDNLLISCLKEADVSEGRYHSITTFGEIRSSDANKAGRCFSISFCIDAELTEIEGPVMVSESTYGDYIAAKTEREIQKQR